MFHTHYASTQQPKAPAALRQNLARTLTPHTPCTNTLPESPGRTYHSAPAKTRAPEWRTPNLSAGHALRTLAQGLPRNPRLHRAHQRAAATATSPNSAAPLDTSHSPSVRRRCWPHSYCASPSRSTNTPSRLSWLAQTLPCQSTSIRNCAFQRACPWLWRSPAS